MSSMVLKSLVLEKESPAFKYSEDFPGSIFTNLSPTRPSLTMETVLSLGNFISAHEVVNTANRVGLMVSLDIEKDSTTSKISINNLESELLYTYYTSNYTDFKVIPFSMIDSNYLSNYKEVYTKYSDIVKSIDNNIKVKELNNAS